MKKSSFVTAVIIAVASICNAQTQVIEKYGETMTEGRPFFTDGGLYNSCDLGGSPLGVFDSDKQRRLGIDLGYRHFGYGAQSGNYLSGQRLTMGEPDRAYFQLYYGPDFLSRKTEGANREADLTLQRFGLAVAGQAGSGFFRGALSAEGFMGNQEWSEGDSTRTYMGLEKVRIDLGSKVHPLVSVGFFVGATLHFDSLRIPGSDPRVRREYGVQTNLPEIGGSVGFGGEGIPVRSILHLSQAWSRFVYGARGVSARPSWINPRGDAHAIVTDSFQLYWMTQGRIPVANDEYVVKPGLMIGFSNSAGKFCVPDAENDPFKIGDPIDSLKYGLGGFYFGAGSGFELLKFADLHAEYGLASMSLDLGNARRYNVDPITSRMLHHTSVGVSSPLHKYIDLPAEITPRLAYFISSSAGMIPARHSSLDPLNNAPGVSRVDLYNPQNFLEGFTRTSGLTLGIDGTALDNLLSVSYWMTFLSKNTTSKGGTELGLTVGLSL